MSDTFSLTSGPSITRCPNCLTTQPPEHDGWVETVDGEVCPICAGEYMACDSCGEFHLTSNTTHIHGEEYCESCRDDLFYVCADCGDYVRTDESYTGSDDKSYCQRCFDRNFTTCYGCGETVHTENTHYSPSGSRPYCESCFDDRYSTCDGCGEAFRREYPDDDCHCDDCREEEEPSAIRPYSYKPTPLFQGKGLLHLGFELEVQSKGRVEEGLGEMAQKVIDILPYTYCKEDGSVHGGFEIVSHPLTPDFIRENKSQFNRMLHTLSTAAFTSHKTGQCGLHVHISRKALSPLSIYKMQKLVYENPYRMIPLSRRAGESTYAKVTEMATDLPKKTLSKYHPSRYEAINLQNEHTVEVRIFRGSLRPESFFGTLQFAEAIVGFCNITAIPDITWDAFCAYVATSPKVYADLITCMKSKNVWVGV